MSKKINILNLFSGIGGNVQSWNHPNVKITSVDNRQDILNCYKKLNPTHEIINADAFEFLEKNFKDYDLIWCSPPCTSHSRLNKCRIGRAYNNSYSNDKFSIPDMRLYGIIFFLQHLYRGIWIVENVIPYYELLIKPTCKIGRHVLWSNLEIKDLKQEKSEQLNNWKKEAIQKGLELKIIESCKFESRIDTIIHNCVNRKESEYIFNYIKKEFNLE